MEETYLLQRKLPNRQERTKSTSSTRKICHNNRDKVCLRGNPTLRRQRHNVFSSALPSRVRGQKQWQCKKDETPKSYDQKTRTVHIQRRIQKPAGTVAKVAQHNPPTATLHSRNEYLSGICTHFKSFFCLIVKLQS